MTEKISSIFGREQSLEADAISGLIALIDREVEKRVRPLEELLMTSQDVPRVVEEYLDVEELARRIHTEPKTIRDWVHKKKIPFQKLPTGGIRFVWSEIEVWVKGKSS